MFCLGIRTQPFANAAGWELKNADFDSQKNKEKGLQLKKQSSLFFWRCNGCNAVLWPSGLLAFWPFGLLAFRLRSAGD